MNDSRKKKTRSIALVCWIVLSGSMFPRWASAEGDIALGEYLANECVACHQLSGRSVGAIPAIVGWPDDLFVLVMESYRDGERDNQVMRTIASQLSDSDISALAAFFGSLKQATQP